jgi:hypothetical protein
LKFGGGNLFSLAMTRNNSVGSFLKPLLKKPHSGLKNVMCSSKNQLVFWWVEMTLNGFSKPNPIHSKLKTSIAKHV